MHAICDNGHVVGFSNHRGDRMPRTCSVCQAPLHKATYDFTANTYRRLEPTATNTRRTFERCALCGKRRAIPGGGRRVEVTEMYGYYEGHGILGTIWKTKLVEQGKMVCWFHQPVKITQGEKP